LLSLTERSTSSRSTPTGRSWAGARWLTGAAIASVVLGASLLVSSSAVAWWAAALTATQAMAMVACSRDRRAGWAVALSLQLPWAIYDVLTRQYPFIATSLICTVAQATAICRLSRTPVAPDMPDRRH
jgi:hypothetical protein